MKTVKKTAYFIGMLRKYGLRGLHRKNCERKADTVDQKYRSEWKTYMVSQEEWQRQRDTAFPFMPLISVVVPVYRTPEPFLRAMVESVKEQSYWNWELCIADGSDGNEVKDALERCAEHNTRIRYQKLEKNGGISENTNAAISMARGVYIGFLDHDDMLAKNALFEVVRAIHEHPECEILYSDEDKIDETGKRHMRPHFKTDYDRELLLHYNYFCHFLVVRRSLFYENEKLRTEYNGAQDYDLVLRLTEAVEAETSASVLSESSVPSVSSVETVSGRLPGWRICHIPKILYHWRMHEGSTAGSFLSKDYAYEAGKRALTEHFKRCGIVAEVSTVKGGGYYKVSYPKEENADGIAKVVLSDYATRQALDQAIAERPEDYILLLGERRFLGMSNRDIIKLASLCRQRSIGLVGVRYARKKKLLFPKEFIGLPVDWKGYFYRAAVSRNMDWLPLDVCMVRKTAYFAAGGIELEKGYRRQAPNFCSRVRRAGYEVVMNADVTVEI